MSMKQGANKLWNILTKSAWKKNDGIWLDIKDLYKANSYIGKNSTKVKI